MARLRFTINIINTSLSMIVTAWRFVLGPSSVQIGLDS